MSLSYITPAVRMLWLPACVALFLQTTENTIAFIARRRVPFTLTNNQSSRAVFRSEPREQGGDCFRGIWEEKLMFQVRIFFFQFCHLKCTLHRKGAYGCSSTQAQPPRLFIDRRCYFLPAVSALDLVTGAKLH